VKNPVLVLCLLGVLSFGTSAGQQRESPGKLEIAKHPLILEPPPPPPPQSQHKIDVDKLHEEANEIEKLALAVTADVGQITQGKMPQGAIDRLKRIEKLSKELRTQMTR